MEHSTISGDDKQLISAICEPANCKIGRPWLQFSLIALMLVFYGALLWFSASPASRHPPLNLTFNSMLDHLLKGHFDVDPQIVGKEGFFRGGKTYSYWGIWCALLRLPLWAIGRMDFDMTVLSCLLAACIAGIAKIRAVLLIASHSPQSFASRSATSMMLTYIVFGGSGLSFLRAMIFQEVVFWGAAFASVFIYFAIKGLIHRRFDLSTLCGMALCAGLALLTRVSFGIGLILAFGFLLLALIFDSSQEPAANLPMVDRWKNALLQRRILLAVAILVVCILATGAVNYYRWGSPTTFVDFRTYVSYRDYPDRVLCDASYGLFSLSRIPFGLSYYFAPIWALRTASGHFLFEATQVRLFDGVELPPGSFFLTDLLPFCFIAFLAFALRKRRACMTFSPRNTAAIAVGLFAPWVLMLTATYEAYRYRMEFYPEIDFLALYGLYMVLTDHDIQAKFLRYRVWLALALSVSVVSSFVMLFIYDLAPQGPSQMLLIH